MKARSSTSTSASDSRPSRDAGQSSSGDRTAGDRVARVRSYRERAKARGETPERPKREPSPWARIGLLTLGGALIAIGIAGLVLPGIQGVITIVAGLVVLSLGSRTAHRWTRRRLRRWPKILDRYERMRRALRRRFRRRKGPAKE